MPRYTVWERCTTGGKFVTNGRRFLGEVEAESTEAAEYWARYSSPNLNFSALLEIEEEIGRAKPESF